MNKYHELLTQLLSQETTIDNNNIFISAYIPTAYDLRQDKYTHFKSLILKALRDSDLITESDKYNEITNLVLKKIEDKSTFLDGIGLFMNINKNKKLTLDRIQMVDLLEEPKEEVVVAMTYDLDQLFSFMNRSVSAFVLNIERKKTQLYSMQDKTFHHLADFENEFVYSENQVYMERFSPTRQTNVVHSTGGKNLERSSKSADQKYIKSIAESMKEIVEGEDINYLVVIYSKYFEKRVDDLANTLEEATKLKPLLKCINVSSEEEMMRVAWDSLMDHLDEQKKQIIDKSQENPNVFVTDWSDIAANVRMHKVGHLFLRPNIKKEGYIDNNQDVYLDNADDRVKVDNIVPWLVKKAVETSAEIILLEEDDGIESDIAAFLRY